MSKSSAEIITEMEGQPMPAIANELARILDEAGVEVSALDLVVPVQAATLKGLHALASVVGSLAVALNADLDPEQFATDIVDTVLLGAQAAVYDRYLPVEETQAEA